MDITIGETVCNDYFSKMLDVFLHLISKTQTYRTSD